MAKKFGELEAKMTPEARERITARVTSALEAMPLEELRQAQHFTQKQLAATLGTSQGHVSKMERQADMYVSTLRSYIKAMGGRLSIAAVFPQGAVEVSQFAQIGGPSNAKVVYDHVAENALHSTAL